MNGLEKTLLVIIILLIDVHGNVPQDEIWTWVITLFTVVFAFIISGKSEKQS